MTVYFSVADNAATATYPAVVHHIDEKRFSRKTTVWSSLMVAINVTSVVQIWESPDVGCGAVMHAIRLLYQLATNNTAQEIRPSKIRNISTAIICREISFTETIQRVLNYARSFEENSRCVLLKRAFWTSSRIWYRPAFWLQNPRPPMHVIFMARRRGWKSRVFCLCLRALPWMGRWWRRWSLRLLMTQYLTFTLRRKSFSWFKPPVHSWKSSVSPPPITPATSTATKGLFDELHLCHMKQDKEKLATFGLFSNEDSVAGGYYPCNVPVYYYDAVFWLLSKQKIKEVGGEGWGVEGASASKSAVPLQFCSQIAIELRCAGRNWHEECSSGRALGKVEIKRRNGENQEDWNRRPWARGGHAQEGYQERWERYYILAKNRKRRNYWSRF